MTTHMLLKQKRGFLGFLICLLLVHWNANAQDTTRVKTEKRGNKSDKSHQSGKFHHVDSLVYDFSKGEFINTQRDLNFTHDFFINKYDRLIVVVTNINQIMYQTDLKLNARNITYDATNQDFSKFITLVKAVSKSPDSTSSQNTLNSLKSGNQTSSEQIQASVAKIGSQIDDLFKNNRIKYSPDGSVQLGKAGASEKDSLNLEGKVDISNALWTYYNRDNGYMSATYPGYSIPHADQKFVKRGDLLGAVKVNMIEMKQNVQSVFTWMNDTIFTFMARINNTRNNYYSLISQVSKATQSNLSHVKAVTEILTTIENFIPRLSFNKDSVMNERALQYAIKLINGQIASQIDTLFVTYKGVRSKVEGYSDWLKRHTDLLSRLYYPFSFSDTINGINTFVDSTVKSTLYQMDTIYNNTIDYIGKVQSGILDFIRFANSKQNFEIVATKDDIDADKVVVLFQAIPQEQFTSSLLSKYVKALNYDTLAIVKVRSGVVVNVSTGFFWNFGLADRAYRLDTFFRNNGSAKTDSVQINEAKSINQYLPSFGALLHVYKRTLSDVSWGGAFGLSINADGGYSAYLGCSLIIGKTPRFILSGGLAGARLKYLSSSYKVGDLIPISRQIQPSDLPTSSAYRFGGFVSISFNLNSITK